MNQQLTPIYLKAVSQKFDLQTIFVLDISSKALVDVSLLRDCTNLVVLDLSRNQVSSLSGFDHLTCLQRLDISYNCITNLAPLRACEKLTHLSAQGNRIRQITKIEVLKENKKLRVLYLQEFDLKTGKNPICEGNESYRMQIYQTLPQLERLDGHTRASKGGLNDEAVLQIEQMPSGKPKYESIEQWYSKELENRKFLAIESGLENSLSQLQQLMGGLVNEAEKVKSIYDLL